VRDVGQKQTIHVKGRDGASQDHYTILNRTKDNIPIHKQKG